ncbi:MAG: hypothetical protein ABIP20_08895 [Chthoniobacteraceae bacterium]
MIPLLNVIPALVLIGAMIWGFKLAGRWAKSVPVQMFLGLLLGFGILIGVVCVLFGVVFAGCLIMGSPSFH